MTSVTVVCCVCSEPLDAQTEAYCDACGQPYHLNQRNDLPGKDCGQVWINEEHLALQFECDNCLHPAPEPASLADIIDGDEAAALAGLDPAILAAAAESGELRHRRTASGVYLFQRGDVLAFARAGR